jgi:spore maturation protein CgeB
MPTPPFCETFLYHSISELVQRHAALVESADACVVGSYVPDGAAVAEFVTRTSRGVTGFYDIDTPVTVRALAEGNCEYLNRTTIPEFDVYLSFTGGPTLQTLCSDYGARRAEPLYCSVDPELYYPGREDARWALGYLGTYSDDRQPTVERLLCAAARQLPQERFIVAGPQYPETIGWPSNVERVFHISPQAHRNFYCAQRATLNVTRRDMVQAGYAPSVRLFEAAACGVPIISDVWPGIESFFIPDTEILLARDTEDVLRHLSMLAREPRAEIGKRARSRVMREHTAAHRAASLENLVHEIRTSKQTPSRTRVRAVDAPIFASEVER